MASALARATRCCCPPDIWWGYFDAWSAEADQLEQLGRLLPSLVGALPAHPQAVGDVVERVHVREQRVALEHHPHVPRSVR